MSEPPTPLPWYLVTRKVRRFFTILGVLFALVAVAAFIQLDRIHPGPTASDAINWEAFVLRGVHYGAWALTAVCVVARKIKINVGSNPARPDERG